MATSIQFLRSNIEQLRPDPATLAEGMPMVNLHEGEPGLFFRLRDGSLAKVGPVSVSATAPNSSAQGFAGNTIGEQWVDTSDPTTPQLKIWDGTQWLDISTGSGGGGSGQKGQKGQKGGAAAGTKGIKGQKGLTGSQGAIGGQGTKGQKGEQNDKGEKGSASQLLIFEGVVNTPGDIPAAGNVVGSAYLVLSTGTYHAWTGTTWLDVGSVTKGEVGASGQKGQKGTKGELGLTGTSGTKGTDGIKGQKGLPGSATAKGDKGPKGEIGVGAKGEKGTGGKGDKGEQGEGAAALPALYFRGNVANTGLLPLNASSGDTYYVIDEATYYTWDGATPTATWWNVGNITKGERGQKGLDGNGSKGQKGNASSAVGPGATVNAGTTTTVPSTSPALVTNSGTTSAAIFDFNIPQGAVGPKGEVATINIGTTTTTSSANPAVVVNSGTSDNATLEFTIPKGETGPIGNKGQKGIQGPTGVKGANGNKGEKGGIGAVGNQGEILFNLNGTDVGADSDLAFDPVTDTLTTPDIVATGEIEVRNSPTQDGIKLVGRPGGTSDFDVSITPDPLSADRTLVIPDEDGVIMTTGSADVITSNMIVDNEILNADINAAAGIEVSKLEDVAPGEFIVGDATSSPAIVPMSGDATLSDTGQVDIIDDVNLGGDPTTTTQLTSDNSTKVATTAFVQQRVDEAIQGLDVKTEVRATTTGANITLSGLQTIDGVAVQAGDRVLVKDQTNPNDNGIYEAAAGAWTRPADADVFSELVGAFVFTSEGTLNVDSGFFCQAQSGGTIGSDPIPWTQFSGAGQIIAGGGMTKAGNQLDVNTADPTRIVVNGDDIDLATTAIAAGSYREVTVDTYGRAVAGSNPTTFAGYGLSDSSASLAAALTDETGTGFAVFSDSPDLTGVPTAPTATAGDNSNTLATTAYVDSATSSSNLTNGDIFIGNVSGVATAQTMSGDATIGNTGIITIEDGAVNSNKILDGSIQTVDIGDDQITSPKILNAAVITSKINDGAVTSDKILDGTIQTIDIGDDQITNIKIADAAVDTNKLANDSVTSAKIVDGTIVTDDLAASAVTSAKIADGTIQTIDLADSSVTSAKIADGTIVTADVANSAVTTAKINDGAVTTVKLADDSVTSAKIIDGSIVTDDLADASVTSAKIADGTIVTADLADNSVTSAKIVDGTISTNDLADSSITSIKIADGTIVNADISDSTIQGAKLVNNIALPGSPSTTTQTQGDNSTNIATTAYADLAVSDAVTSLTTLNSANIFVGNVSNVSKAVAMSGDATIDNTGQVTLASSINLTGTPTAVTQTQGDNSTALATTAYVDAAAPGLPNGEIFIGDASGSASTAPVSGDATLDTTGSLTIIDDLALGGSPTTATQPSGTNNTTIATTAFVSSAVVASLPPLTSGDIFIGDASNKASAVTVTGDVTISTAGVTDIIDDVALGGSPTTTTQTAGDNSTKIATTSYADSAVLNGDRTLLNAQFFVGDVSNLAVGRAMSGDATLTNTGQIDIVDDVNLGGSPTTTTQTAGDNSTKIATTAYVDNASATPGLTTGDIFIGDSGGVAVGRTMSGDVTITTTGVTAIAANVALAGSPTTTTATAGDNSTKIATTAYVDAASASALTNGEIFVGNAANSPVSRAMSGDVTLNNLGLATIKDDVALAGSPTTTTQGSGDNSTKIATTAYVDSAVPGLSNGDIFVGDASGVATSRTMSGDVTISNTGVASIANSVNLGGTPTAVTQTAGDNSTAIATTAYVDAASGSALTNGEIYVGNVANSPVSVALTGDATINNTGLLTIANDAVTTAKIIDGAITSDKILDGTIATVDIADGAVDSAKILDDTILNVDINSAAGIELTKLEAITSGEIVVGSATNVGTAVAISGDVTLSNTGQIDIIDDVNLGGDPTTTTQLITDDSTKIATTAFVQSKVADAIQGLDAKESVDAATTGDITLSGTQTIDGIALSNGDRVLVKDQATQSENGIYEVGAGGWLRTSDADTWEDLVGAFVYVQAGTLNGSAGFTSQTDDGGTLGTDPVPFTQFNSSASYSAGDGLSLTGTQFAAVTEDTANIVVSGTGINLATTAIAAGTYTSLTIDTYGRATGGSNPTTFAGYGINDTSANLAAALTDETGTGSVVFSESPTFTGAPLAPTAPVGTNTTQVATTAFVLASVTGGSVSLNSAEMLVGDAGNNAVAVTISGDGTIDNTGALALIDNLALGGSPTTTTQAQGDNSTNVATTSYVDTAVSGLAPTLNNSEIFVGDASNAAQSVALSGDATIDNTGLLSLANNLALGGTPTTSTQTAGDNSTAVATTAYVDTAVGAAVPTLNNGNIFVGDATNAAQSVAMSGDVTIDNTGATAISLDNGKIFVGDAANAAQGVALSGDITIDNTGAATIATNVALAGSPTTTTQAQGDNSTNISTTAYVDAAIAAVPGATQLSAGEIFLGNAANATAQVTMSGDVTIDNIGATSIASNVALGGSPTTTTQAQGDNSTNISTTEYVDVAIAAYQPELDPGDIFIGDGSSVATSTTVTGDVTISQAGVTTISNSVALGGSPTTTTQTQGDNSTNISTTAYVDAAIAAVPGATQLNSGEIFLGNASNATDQVAMSGDVTMDNTGVTTIRNDVVLGGNPQAVTQAPGNSSTRLATTEYVTLAVDIARALDQGNIYIGNNSSVAESVPMTGEVTISQAGVTTIANDAITTVKILDGAVDSAKILDDTIVNADINSAAAIDYSKLAPITPASLILGDASSVPTVTAMSGDVTLSDTGVATIRNNVVLNGNPKATTAPITNEGDRIATTSFVHLLVNDAVQGLDTKEAVVVASKGNFDFLQNLKTVDGVKLVDGDRVLVKDQTDQSENGIYVAQAGTWSRADDASTWDELVGAFVFVQQGTENGGAGFVSQSVTGGTLETDPIPFSQFNSSASYTAGDGLSLTGTVFAAVTEDSANITVSGSGINLATTGVAAGDYTKTTVDAYGRVTSGSNPTTFTDYGISAGSGNLRNAVTNTTGTSSLVFQKDPELTGVPIAPTAAAGDNSTQIATTAYVDGAITSVTGDFVEVAGDDMTGDLTLSNSGSTTVTLEAATGAVTTVADASFNGVTVGRGGGDNANSTAVGANALAVSTAAGNVAVGVSALNASTTGGNNVAIGRSALLVSTTGINNVGIGNLALSSTIDGARNVAIGTASGGDNVDGSKNTCIGYQALQKNITGTNNVAIGNMSGRQVLGSNNTILGPADIDATEGATLSDTIILAAGTTRRVHIDSTGSFLFGGGDLPNTPAITLNDDGSSAFTGDMTMAADILPDADKTRNLGSASLRFANVYTGDLHLRNDRGDWTMIEEEDALTLRNNVTGKVYNIMMEERK